MDLISKLTKSYDDATAGMTEEEKKARNRKILKETDTKEKAGQAISDKVSKETNPMFGAAVATGMNLIDTLAPKDASDILISAIPGGKVLKAAKKSKAKQAKKIFENARDKNVKELLEAGSKEKYSKLNYDKVNLDKQARQIKKEKALADIQAKRPQMEQEIRDAGILPSDDNIKLLEQYNKYVTKGK